ncbi:MAG: methyltransferase domain-containing protein [Candidatus Marinimicrobia bacterium]|nr:methyltransferase domain-containing protein [Candidatus Neomarinimicrobiota bacterium]MCF7827880.1 methyltransferase domain-containing protein [Candidatus Neomarinimicrobiota bacterium]MCF7879365.1 methyltransferase domain-containing protein [Candidatus Neomarinimicrobiota bacterium]
METQTSTAPDIDFSELRTEIQKEYATVATEPDRGFHFHTGRRAVALMEYEERWLTAIPKSVIASFSGTGNPFLSGALQPGERVVDIGSGGGMDSLVAAQMVGENGYVIGVDMTPAMLQKARRGKQEMQLENVEFRKGQAEELPVPDDWADVIISNGVFNLIPDKVQAVQEMDRVLQPGGRLQIADIKVKRAVSEEAKSDIDLWTG